MKSERQTFRDGVSRLPVGCLNTVTLGSLGSFALHLSEGEEYTLREVDLGLPVAHAWLWGGGGEELT